MVGGSKSVRGRKKRRKAINQAPRNAVTLHQTKRLRPTLAWLGSGPTVAKPPAAAAFDVPTAGVPTYLVASVPPGAGDFAASGLGLTVSDSGAAMHYLLVEIKLGICARPGTAPPTFPLNCKPVIPRYSTNYERQGVMARNFDTHIL